MPGKAFTADLGQAAFPLLPTQTHQQLKASLGDKIHSFYAHVGSPAPATDKREHGDVELIVCLEDWCAIGGRGSLSLPLLLPRS